MISKVRLLLFLLILGLALPASVHGGLYNTQTFSLPNGLQVYVIENHRVPAVTQMVVYRVGSADDPLGKSGLAHYMEHMMFKGPLGSASERLTREVNAVGGGINAATSFDVTYYYEIVPKEHLSRIMELEGERMKSLEVVPEQAQSEMQVVLEEEHMRMGNEPVSQFFRNLRLAFYNYHPYRLMPIGWRSEIKSYTPADIQNFHDRWYAPDNAFIILSGDITVPDAQRLTQKYYGSIPSKKSPPRHRVQEPVLEKINRLTQKSPKITQPYVAFMLPAPSYAQEAPSPSYALSLLVYSLGNEATGLLHQRLVEDLKVATFVSLQYDPYLLDTSNLTILAQAAPGITADRLEDALTKELQAIVQTGLTQAQLEKYKTQFLSSLDYLKDSLLAGADHLIDPLIKGVPLQKIEEWPDTLGNLSLEAVNATFKKYFTMTFFTVGHLLPLTPHPPVSPDKETLPEMAFSEVKK